MNPTKSRPARGELWWIDWDQTARREQQGRRPGLVVSVNRFNASPAGLVVAVPLTTRPRPFPFRVEIAAAPDGLSRTCYAIVEG
ncbi:MAG: type II toxin-antitoxin system PemK/MazF family toxin, partial [Deltaproteobacteria bacterium]|nr:type II toxin-antitoxin system PemK/MazF family toxin [Deltaproteobacteria bacterium]